MMSPRVLLLTLLAAACCMTITLAARPVLYSGTQVLRAENFSSLTHSQRFAFQALTTKFKSWGVKEWAMNDIQVPAESLPVVREYLRENKIATSVFIQDLQKEIDREDAFHELHRAKHGRNVSNYASPNDFFSDYHSNDDITTFCQNLAKTYPQLVSTSVIGTSYGGLPIHVYKVTSQKNPSPKPAIYLEFGIHAREWIAHSSGTWMLNEVVTQYGNDTHITSLLDQLEFHFVPVVNVDGYVYTWTTDRMWRKTTKPNPGSTCIGTDPNRNWNNHWCEDGASTDPCDDSFCGSNAFSEACVKTVADYVSNNQNIQVGVDFHSYSQLWMTPYGYTQSLPVNNAQQTGMADAAVAALTAVYGTQYQEGPIYTTVYPASGSSADYFYDNTTHVKYSFGVELRDTGTYGFVLPPDQIVPSGQETLQSILAMGDYLLKNPISLESDLIDVVEIDQPRVAHHKKKHHGSKRMPHFGNAKAISRRPQL